MHQEVWPPPQERVWSGQCELGGIERGAVIHLSFFAAVDESVNLVNRTLKIGYGTCGEESYKPASDFWSSGGEMFLRRISNQDTIQVYRYIGYADTLVLFNMRGVKTSSPLNGWSVVDQSDTHVVFAVSDASGPAEFAIQCEDSLGSTGLINWRDSSTGINYGFGFGPGSAQYSVLDTVAAMKEAEWITLLPGMSVVLILVVALTVGLHRQKRRRR